MHVSGQQSEDRWSDEQKQCEARDLRHWRAYRARADPADAEQAEHQRQAESGKAFKLEEQIAQRGPEDPRPVMGDALPTVLNEGSVGR